MARIPSLLIPFNEEDYLATARSRYTMAFEDRPVFDKYIQLIQSATMDVQDVLLQLIQNRTLEEATGTQLDLVGDIVGQKRTLVNVDFVNYFGMLGSDFSATFGDLHDLSAGGLFWDLSNSGKDIIVLNDELYRILIKARIMKNTTNATPEDIIRFFNFVLSTDKTTIQDGNGHINVILGRQISQEESIILSYIEHSGIYDVTTIPKPLGVSMTVGSRSAANTFAFQKVPDAYGYGTVFDATKGGYWASARPGAALVYPPTVVYQDFPRADGWANGQIVDGYVGADGQIIGGTDTTWNDVTETWNASTRTWGGTTSGPVSYISQVFDVTGHTGYWVVVNVSNFVGRIVVNVAYTNDGAPTDPSIPIDNELHSENFVQVEVQAYPPDESTAAQIGDVRILILDSPDV